MYNVILDKNSVSYNELRAKQYDSLLPLIVFFYYEGQPLTLSEYTRIELRALKEDGNFVIQEKGMTKVGNQLTIDLDKQISTSYGKTVCEIMLFKGDKVDISFDFIINYDKAVLGRALESKTNIDLIEQLDENIKAGQVLNVDIVKNTGTANTSNNTLKATITNANTQNTTLTQTINNATTIDNSLKSLVPRGEQVNATIGENTTKAQVVNTDLSNNLQVGQAFEPILDNTVNEALTVDTSLKQNITTAQGFMEQLNSDVANGTALTVELDKQVKEGNVTNTNLTNSITQSADAIGKINATQNKSYIINSSDWVEDTVNKVFKYTLTHTAKTLYPHISVYTYNTTTKKPADMADLGAVPTDENTIIFTSINNDPYVVVLSAGYFGGYLSPETQTEINNLKNNKVDKSLKTGSTTDYKVLSDNNFTNEHKIAVEGLASKNRRTRIDTLGAGSIYTANSTNNLSESIKNFDMIEIITVGYMSKLIPVRNAQSQLHYMRPPASTSDVTNCYLINTGISFPTDTQLKIDYNVCIFMKDGGSSNAFQADHAYGSILEVYGIKF